MPKWYRHQVYISLTRSLNLFYYISSGVQQTAQNESGSQRKKNCQRRRRRRSECEREREYKKDVMETEKIQDGKTKWNILCMWSWWEIICVVQIYWPSWSASLAHARSVAVYRAGVGEQGSERDGEWNLFRCVCMCCLLSVSPYLDESTAHKPKSSQAHLTISIHIPHLKYGVCAVRVPCNTKSTCHIVRNNL